MEANAFTGTCECNSTYNGNPVGENFSTEKVVFDRRLFKADMGAQFVQIIYPQSLIPVPTIWFSSQREFLSCNITMEKNCSHSLEPGKSPSGRIWIPKSERLTLITLMI